MFLSALEQKLGADKGMQVFQDLREANDPEAPVTVPGDFPYELPSSTAPGSAVVDDGSFSGSPLAQPAFASNALLIGAKRSATGHPLFVAGPQVGYFFPEFFAEIDLEGGGFSTRGARLPRRARSSSSGAGPTSRGAPPRRRRTTSTSSSRRSAAATTTTTCSGASASRCSASTPAC